MAAIRAADVICLALILLVAPLSATYVRYPTEYCSAAEFALPGFHSRRALYPADEVWDGLKKVTFQNADCAWLAGNFRDTGSDFVAVFFPGWTMHKEVWPLPELTKTLADKHGLSSLVVDFAGRGESCGYETGPDCTSAVCKHNASCTLPSSDL